MRKSTRAAKIARRELAATKGKADRNLAAASKWWKSLTPAQQKKYLADHPSSKLGQMAKTALHDEMRTHLDKMARDFQPHPTHANAIHRVDKHLGRAANYEDESSPAGRRVYATHAMTALKTLRAGLPKVKLPEESPEHKGHAKHVTKAVKNYLHGAGTYSDFDAIGTHGPASDTIGDAHVLARIASKLHRGAHSSEIGDEMYRLSDHTQEEIHPKTWKKFMGNDY